MARKCAALSIIATCADGLGRQGECVAHALKARRRWNCCPSRATSPGAPKAAARCRRAGPRARRPGPSAGAPVARKATSRGDAATGLRWSCWGLAVSARPAWKTSARRRRGVRKRTPPLASRRRHPAMPRSFQPCRRRPRTLQQPRHRPLSTMPTSPSSTCPMRLSLRSPSPNGSHEATRCRSDLLGAMAPMTTASRRRCAPGSPPAQQTREGSSSRTCRCMISGLFALPCGSALALADAATNATAHPDSDGRARCLQAMSG